MLKRNKKSGFSLVEIVVVIAILAVLAGVLAPALLSHVELSRMQKDESAMSEVVNAVHLALSDAEVFDEAFSYCVKNNYLTYSDSSGKYGQTLSDEEFWAPDGSGAAVTITFNPDGNGNYDISKGLINDMTYGNGSVAEKRTSEDAQQCYLSEMGNQALYKAVEQSVGRTLNESSATYRNSSYTVFIKFNIVDGTRKADVYGQYNGTNLSENCPAAIGTKTSEYVNEEPVVKKSGGVQRAIFSNSDLVGSGSVISNEMKPAYKLACKGHKYEEGSCECKWCGEEKPHTYSKYVDKCDICWKITEHNCTGYPCKYCGLYAFSVSKDNRSKIGYTGESNEELIIPETFVDTDKRGYIVKGINADAFNGCANLYSITLPNSITDFGQGAFQNCTSLSFVTLSDNITEIPRFSFQSCKSLKSIKIPEGVKRITWVSFAGCESLNTIILPDSITHIEQEAFLGCKSLKAIELPNRTVEIGNKAFSGCSALSSLKIPNSVTRIGGSAFSDCTSLMSVEFGNGVTTIDNSAFYNCKLLSSIKLPRSINKIGASAFCKCSNLESINIPDGVYSINQSTFSGCKSLKSIILPESITSIENSAFNGCSSLTEINIPIAVSKLGSSAFNGCISLSSIEIPANVTSIPDSLFMNCSNLAKVVIPEGITNIGASAFYGCTLLTSIELPNTINRIGPHGTFNSCKDISYNGTIQQWSEILRETNWGNSNIHCKDGCVMNKAIACSIHGTAGINE